MILEKESDIFQLKSDFIAFSSGLISILVHIPLADSSTKLKLYKFVATPVVDKKYQFLVDNKHNYIAINEDSTLYSTLENLDKCTVMRDSIICNDIKVLHKAGSVEGNDCLYDLYNNLKDSSKS